MATATMGRDGKSQRPPVLRQCVSAAEQPSRLRDSIPCILQRYISQDRHQLHMCVSLLACNRTISAIAAMRHMLNFADRHIVVRWQLRQPLPPRDAGIWPHAVSLLRAYRARDRAGMFDSHDNVALCVAVVCSMIALKLRSPFANGFKFATFIAGWTTVVADYVRDCSIACCAPLSFEYDDGGGGNNNNPATANEVLAKFCEHLEWHVSYVLAWDVWFLTAHDYFSLLCPSALREQLRVEFESAVDRMQSTAINPVMPHQQFILALTAMRTSIGTDKTSVMMLKFLVAKYFIPVQYNNNSNIKPTL